MNHQPRRIITVGIDKMSDDTADLDWAIDTARRTRSVVHLALATSSNDPAAQLRPYIRYAESMGAAEVTTTVHHTERKLLASVDALAAESATSDLVVINHCRHRHMFGETGGQIASHSRCPVIVVPEHWQPPDRTADLTIAVGLGSHGGYEDTLRFAFEQAACVGAPLRVIHVFGAQTAARMSAQSPVRGHDEPSIRQREELAEILAPWEAKYPQVRWRSAWSTVIRYRC
jgi:nucleotide-binding universal stress UspA family protein